MNPRRLQLACELAADRGGVVAREQLARAGISEIHVRRAVGSDRWMAHGRQTISVHTGPLATVGLDWQAIWETGESIAALDGVTALQVAGLKG